MRRASTARPGHGDPPSARPSVPAAQEANAQPAPTVRHRVTVYNGFAGVSHLVNLLRQRQYRITFLDARAVDSTERRGSDMWVITYGVELTKQAEELLIKRVNQLASVVKVSSAQRLKPQRAV